MAKRAPRKGSGDVTRSPTGPTPTRRGSRGALRAGDRVTSGGGVKRGWRPRSAGRAGLAAAYVVRDEWGAADIRKRLVLWARDLSELDAELRPLADRVEYLRRWRAELLHGLMALENSERRGQ